MNKEQAINIMEQAVMLACKNDKTNISDIKAIVVAWDTIKAELNRIERVKAEEEGFERATENES